uniref:Uncharacterized protein n=1 Tax=Lygus hesperus TaxID=30085 RepID=A0A0K8T7N1_LYGHE
MRIRRVNYLVAGEYRRSALDLAAKCSQMNENMKNISESKNVLDLICLSSTKNFFDRMEYLKLYVTKCLEAFQDVMNKKGGNSLSSVGGSLGDHASSPRFPDNNLERIFDDCVHMKALIVQIQSRIEGVTEIENALERTDLLTNISNGDHPVAEMSDDLFKVCYDHVRTEFLRKEVKYNQEKQSRRREILAFMENIRSVARPLRRCGESFVLLIKEECKWIRINRAMLSDTLGGLLEIQHQIEQSYKQLVNIRTVHELSSATHTCPDISSTFLKFFDVSSSSHNDTASSVSFWPTHCHDKKIVRNVMSRMYAGRLDSAFKMMKNFSEDVMNLLSFAKMAHCYLFNGPSAIFSVDSDLISSIIKISRELNAKKQELEKLDCRRFEVEIHRRNNEHRDLLEKFWLLYIQNPHQLWQTVEAIEARSQLSRNHHHASKASDGDCLEKFLL